VGLCAQKDAIAEGFVAAGPPKGRGAVADSSALVQRLQLPLTESGGVVRTKKRHRRKLLCSLAAQGGGAKAKGSALVQRSQEALQLPLTESGGAVRTKRRRRRRLLRSLAAAAARWLAAPRSCSAPKRRFSCRSPRAAGRCARNGHRRRLLCSLGARGGGAKIDNSTLVQRSQEPPQLPFTESRGAMRTRSHPRQRLL
jgi:hypothetical protein